MLEALLRGPDEVLLTPCQLRVTSFASKSRLVDRHPLYVPASAAPHVRASHYGRRLAHCSEQYDHGPAITTTDWQTRSAGDEEVTNLEARGFDGWDHRRRRALVCVNGGRKLTPLELTRRHGVRHPMALRAQVLPVSKPTVLRLRRDHGGLGMPAQDRTSGQSPGSDAAG